jgi:hypothetical protein
LADEKTERHGSQIRMSCGNRWETAKKSTSTAGSFAAHKSNPYRVLVDSAAHCRGKSSESNTAGGECVRQQTKTNGRIPA